jgi:hypothetical protein
MAGQSAGHTLETVHGSIASIREHGGISADETSAIGGSGRKGGAAEGPDIAPRKNIADEFVGSMGGEATTGTTGYGSGFGKTF